MGHLDIWIQTASSQLFHINFKLACTTLNKSSTATSFAFENIKTEDERLNQLCLYFRAIFRSHLQNVHQAFKRREILYVLAIN